MPHDPTILLIDDDPTITEILTHSLGSKGYRSVSAHSGMEGLALAKEQTFDLALVDLQLPDMEGTELLRRIKKALPHLPCCIITGYGTTEHAIAALQSGARDFFVKPFDLDHLFRRLEEILKIERLQRELGSVQDKYRQVVETARDAILTVDRQGLVTFANSHACRLLGKDSSALLGTALASLLDFRQNSVPAVPQAVPLVERLRNSSTRRMPCSSCINGGPAQHFDATVGLDEANPDGPLTLILRDVTACREAEEQLAQRNLQIEKHRRHLQAALDEISRLIKQVAEKEDFAVRFQNPNLKPCYEVRRCEKSSCPCYGKGLQRCWLLEGTLCRSLTEKAGGAAENCRECTVFMEATADPIYMIGEEFNHMMHILERKNIELQETFGKLRETGRQMVQQEKMASIGQLAAGVAHEINNPMGFITSNLGTLAKYLSRFAEFIAAQDNLLAKENTTEADLAQLAALRKKLKYDHIREDAGDLIAESLEGAERVREIVMNLKSFSRSAEKEKQPVDVNLLLENTLKIVWNELKYKARVHRDYGQLPPVLGSPQELTQVFVNLLVNAAQAIPDQGDIRVRTRHAGHEVVVFVSDTGSGISADKLHRIFEPFFTTKEVGKGTGLGLSISYDIIQKHGGSISVESHLDQGTTFTVRLPITVPNNGEGGRP